MVFGRKELRDWLVFFFGIGAVYYAIYGDVKYGLKLFARALFGGVCLAIAYQVALLLLRTRRTLWTAATSAAAARAGAADANRDENKDAEYKRQQGDRTAQLQQRADREGKEYVERVLEPRRLRELEEAEKEYHRFTSGRPFAGLGHALGGFGDASDRDAGSVRDAPRGDDEQDEASVTTSSVAAASSPGDGGTAAYRRRLLVGELATSSNASQASLSTSQVRTPTSAVDVTVPRRLLEARKHAAQLPAEPTVDDPAAVTVGFRIPTGQTHRRRFHKSDRLVVLYDYLSTLGYDDSAYVLATSFPRRLIESQTDVEISAAGLERAVLLNVEARDL